jgi:oligopeptide transport system substrate-binding protein
LKNKPYIFIALLVIMSLLVSSCDIIWPLETTSRTVVTSYNSGKVLNLFSTDPTTLDPAVAGDSVSAQYILEIFSGLLKLNEKLEPSADIASTWEISSDGLTYTFHLRKDVMFQDGSPVTAQDFKYSWERAANPKTKSQTALTYLGDIVGIKEIIDGKTTTASGIKVLDDYTLQVDIDSPKSYFLFKLTYPTSFVLDKNNISSGPNWWLNPIGTGPFILSEWTENQSLTLVKNEIYYGKVAILDEVRYQFYTGNSMDLYETGDIDVTNAYSIYIDAIKDKTGPFYNDLSISPVLSIYYIGFNCAEPPFDDANIRKAFSMAIDKDKMVSLIYKDMVKRADGILPPGIPGYNENLNGLEFNVEKAMELIKNSKYGDVSNLPTITLTTSGYGGGIGSTLQTLVYQWKENLGIDVSIREIEPETYSYKLKDEKNQMFDTGWNADYPHPQDFLDILFSSGANYNYGNYSNSEFDSLIQAANGETNLEKSLVLYKQAEQILINDAACIPITFDQNYLLIQPYVKGYSPNALGSVSLNNVSIISH